MRVVVRLLSKTGERYEQSFDISETPAAELIDVDDEHLASVKYQKDRILRIGTALASEHSAATAVPWYLSGWVLPDRLIQSFFSADAGMIPYWCMVPVWPLESCLADDYYL